MKVTLFLQEKQDRSIDLPQKMIGLPQESDNLSLLIQM